MDIKKILVLFASIGMWVGVTSCNNSGGAEDDLKLLLSQTAEIDAYLEANSLTAIKDINGVRMVVTQLGDAFPAHISSNVDVKYAGRLFSNNQGFDSGTLTNSPVAGFIDGWKFALTTLPAGSKATLYIPSIWGYKGVQQGSIPPNSILVFDIDFTKVTRTTTELQRLASDTVAIDNYLTSKSIVATKDSTGLRYVTTQNSGGGRPGPYDKVSFHVVYKLLTDDTKTVAEYDLTPSSNYYNRVIDQPADGIKLGLTKMNVGSRTTFYIPSLLAFGTIGAAEGNSTTLLIPANANLIVDITLNEIVPD